MHVRKIFSRASPYDFSKAVRLWLSNDLRIYSKISLASLPAAQLLPQYDHTPQEFITHQQAVMEPGCDIRNLPRGTVAENLISKTKMLMFSSSLLAENFISSM